MQDLKDNLNSVRQIQADIAPHSTLIAVSKEQPEAAIKAALDLGVRDFGENRLQEARTHWQDIKGDYPDLTLHFIGHLQSNKADDVVALFDVIHTVDRPRLVNALIRAMEKQGRHLPCFIQVNTGEEPQKGGVLPKDLPALYDMCKKAGLNIRGLMCIPPVGDSAVFHFGLLKRSGQRLGLEDLSMGMSGDYEDALRLGATHIRVGSGLFGSREERR